MPVRRSGFTRHRAFTAVAAVLSLPCTTPAAGTAGGPSDVPPRGSAHMRGGVAAHDGVGVGTPTRRATRTEGVDVSGHQGDMAWPALWGNGVKGACAKATEGTCTATPPPRSSTTARTAPA
ncbi:hypothetical protein GCM10027162_73820 [Streptomyces incanus]